MNMRLRMGVSHTSHPKGWVGHGTHPLGVGQKNRDTSGTANLKALAESVLRDAECGTEMVGQTRDKRVPHTPLGGPSVGHPSAGLSAPAICPRCGEATSSLAVVREDGTLAVVCQRGHWTRAVSRSGGAS